MSVCVSKGERVFVSLHVCVRILRERVRSRLRE